MDEVVVALRELQPYLEKLTAKPSWWEQYNWLITIVSLLFATVLGALIAKFASKRQLLNSIQFEKWEEEIRLLQDLSVNAPSLEHINSNNFREAEEFYKESSLKFFQTFVTFRVLPSVYHSGLSAYTEALLEVLGSYINYLSDNIEPLLDRLIEFPDVSKYGIDTQVTATLEDNKPLLEEAERNRQTIMEDCDTFSKVVAKHIKYQFSLIPFRKRFISKSELVTISTDIGKANTKTLPKKG